MSISSTWLALIPGLTGLLSFLLVGLVTYLSGRWQVMSLPEERSSHLLPTPTGGGLGLVAALLIVSVLPWFTPYLTGIWLKVILPGMLLLSVMGWVDDRRTVSPWIRLVVQFAVSFWLLVSLTSQAGSVGLAHAGAFSWPVFILLTTAVVWVMNAYNFMDGSNGMAGAEGLFAGLVLGTLFLYAFEPGLAVLALMLAAACFGFLPWNLRTASVFLGDAGSVPLGFGLSALTLTGAVGGYFSWPVALLVLSVFLIDSSLTLLRRILKGERWYTPHKQHVYQRLIETGQSHSRVLLIYQVLNLCLVVPGIAFCVANPDQGWLISGLVLLVLTIGWCIASLKWGLDT